MRTSALKLDGKAIAALCYLAAPTLCFVAGWLKTPFAGVAVIGLIYLLVRTCAELTIQSGTFTRPALIYLAALALIWACFGGTGHFFYANTDWTTRDSVYADLTFTSWPPMYSTLAEYPIILRSAIGYYLPPALISSYFDISWAPVILTLWTALGVFLFLVLLPLPRHLGKALAVASLCVVGFSGADILGSILLHGHLPIFPLPLEWWAPWTYTSLTAQLFWAPNHALALWLGTALYFRYRNAPGLILLSLLALPLLLIWTPFAIIGLLPLLILSLMRQRLSLWRVIRAIPPIYWLAFGVLSYLILRYLSLSAVPPTMTTTGTELPPSIGPSLPWNPISVSDDSMRAYGAFVLLEFLLLVIVMWPGIATAIRPELILATLILAVLPVFRLGPSNDLLLRASTPSLVLLLLLILDSHQKGNFREWGLGRTIALASLLSIGALTPLAEFARALTWSRVAPNYSQSLFEAQNKQLPGHYFAVLDAPDLAVLLRAPGLVANGDARHARDSAPARASPRSLR